MIAVALRHAAMPMTHVFAQTDIRDHNQIGIRFLDCAHRFLHHAVVA